MKFKVGDHIIILKNDMYPSLINQTGTVLEESIAPFVVLDSPDNYPREKFRRVGKIAVSENDIELSEIYDSPLMKALR